MLFAFFECQEWFTLRFYEKAEDTGFSCGPATADRPNVCMSACAWLFLFSLIKWECFKMHRRR